MKALPGSSFREADSTFPLVAADWLAGKDLRPFVRMAVFGQIETLRSARRGPLAGAHFGQRRENDPRDYPWAVRSLRQYIASRYRSNRIPWFSPKKALRILTGNQVIHEQQDDRAYQRADKAGGLPGLVPAHELPDIRGRDRPRDAERSGEKKPAGITPWSQEFSDQPYNKPDQDRPNDMHCVPQLLVNGGS